MKNSIKFKRSFGLYFLLLPSIIALILFNFIPMYGVLMAFENYNPVKGIWGSTWVGLDNFIQYFKSYQFGKTLWNTFYISMLGILLSFPLPILLFTSPERGIIAKLLSYIGVTFPNVMGSAKAFPWVYVITELWQHLGWDSILYIAALSSIDPTFYEAAKLDGATKLQMIRYIDIPSILPTVCIQLILRSGSILSVGYEKILLLQNNLNMSGSEVISTYVYKMGIVGGQRLFVCQYAG